MVTDTPTGNAAPVEKNTPRTRLVKHVEDEHMFCSKCGMCEDCGDCDIWGCGRKDIYACDGD